MLTRLTLGQSSELALSALHRRRQVRLDRGEYRLETLGVARDQVALVEELMTPGKIADQSTRFLNQQAAGCHIPFGQAKFPECVIAASSYIGQIKASGATAADAGCLADQAFEHAQVVVQ